MQTTELVDSVLFRCIWFLKGALCAQLIRLQASSNQNDKTLSRNSLMYMSKANLPIAVH